MLEDYVDVAERIRLFYERYPDGRLCTEDFGVLEAGGKDFVCAKALAYRTSDDPQPAVGIAWEPIPGPTPFTRDSELMNAETAAWGRAIIAAGIPSKKMASADEVQARQPQGIPRGEDEDMGYGKISEGVRRATRDQHAKLAVVLKQAQESGEAPPEGEDWTEYAKLYARQHYGVRTRADLTVPQMYELINAIQVAAAPFG